MPSKILTETTIKLLTLLKSNLETQGNPEDSINKNKCCYDNKEYQHGGMEAVI